MLGKIESSVLFFALFSSLFPGESSGTLSKEAEANRIFLKVSQDGKDEKTCWNNGSFPCETLAFALRKPSLNFTTIILAKGVHEMSQDIAVSYFEGLTFEGHLMSSILTCTSTNAGLSFSYGRELIFIRLTIVNCGSKHPSTSRINGTILPISTSLFLKSCITVIFKQVNVKGAYGMGAVFYDVGGNVLLSNVTFKSSREHSYSPIRGISSGGGLYVEFTAERSNISTEFNSNTFYNLSSCIFHSNIAENDLSLASPDNDPNNFVSFGRGGGFSLISQGSATNNTYFFNKCHFENNTALWGAGIFVEFHYQSGKNILTVQDTYFIANKATYGGGGIRSGLVSDHTRGLNLIRLKNCSFIDNEGQLGGGFSQYRETKNVIDKEVTIFEKCVFIRNKAFIGAGIHMSVSWFELHGTVLSDNMVTHYQEETSGKGALYLFSSKGILKNGNNFKHNIWTALVLEFSSLELFNDIKFIRNIGIKGGAIAAYGDSFIVFREGSRIDFIENRAVRLGGALYVKTPGPPMAPMKSTEFMVYKCALLFGDEDQHSDTFDTRVNFINNTAPTASGGSVFMSTLNWCRQYGENKYNNTALQWGNFYYEKKDLQPPIVTNPVIIEIHGNDWNPPPSIRFSPRLILRDELWNSTYGTVKVKVTSSVPSVSLIGSDVFAVKDVLPKISIIGPEQSLFNVTIETVVGVTVRVNIENRKLRKCPLGYFQGSTDLVCKCLSSQGIERGVTHCQADKIFILRGRWGDPKGDNEDFAKHHCPRNYCARCQDQNGVTADINCMYNKSRQCGKNRQWDSVLCGSCKEGYSVQLGNEDCEKCSNMHLFWLLLWIFALTVFVLVIMLLNVKHYFTYLNAYLYSYQVLPLLLVGNHYLDKFISFVMGLTNFSGTGGNFGVCLWDGMTDLQKLTLNYITPTYIILCTVFIGFISFHCKWCPFNKKSTLRALAMLSIFAYADFTRITFELLHYVEVNGQAVVYLQGDVRYFRGEHIIYAFLAILVLIAIVLLFPLGLIFFPLLTGSFVKLKGIIDSFQEPFKQDYERFAAFYLICRCILFAIFVFSETGVVRDVLLAIACEIVLIIFIFTKPYTEEKMNYFDALLLANIAFVGTINVALNAITDKHTRSGLQIAATILTYLPFICIFLQFSHWAFIALKEYIAKRRRDSTEGRTDRVGGPKFPQRVLETDEDVPYHSRMEKSQRLNDAASEFGTYETDHEYESNYSPYHAYQDSVKF